jgi:hypothetical protein
LPKRPGEVELKVLKEMFEASVDGQAYDPDRWSQYYKPSGFQGRGGDDVETAAPAPAAKAAPVAVQLSAPFDADEEDDAPVATAPVQAAAAKPSSQRAEDILAMIRNRAK